MNPIRFALAGAGWRAEFFTRIAAELPERYQVTGVLARNPQKAAAFSARWQVPCVGDLDALLAPTPEFVVVSVPWPVTPQLLSELAGRGVAALAETPPAPDVAGLTAVTALAAAGARLQVAEQYAFQPMHAARLAVIASGRLGTVAQAQVSAAHGYHGISLLRRALGIEFEPCRITARRFSQPLVAGPGRDGPPRVEGQETEGQVLAWLDFGGRLGVFDFSGAQYFSWIRSNRLLVRGERGEIHDSTVRWLADFQTPLQADLLRRDTGLEGNLEGYDHAGITLGGEWVYRNPFRGGRLSDDEVAVATCLDKMSAYVAGGPEFYSVAEAAQDHYLGLLIDQAAASGEAVEAAPQAWTP